jgi:uncharacterized protein YcaQ
MISTAPTTIYPVEAVRTVALHAQRLTTPLGSEPVPTADAIYDTVDHLGCVQIDTLQMVQRSQYLALWSRLGTYDPADLDRVAYGGNGVPRRLFEYWMHAACLIPLTDFRYRLPTMRYHLGRDKWFDGWQSKPENRALMRSVLERVRREGALRASDFEHPEVRRGTWWDWKPAKHALEQHFNQGTLMIAGRMNFQRVYDLPERVLPDWVDTGLPSDDETQRFLVQRSLQTLGICEPAQAGSMVGAFKTTVARSVVRQLVAEGVAAEVRARLSDGEVHTLVIHCELLPLLEQAASGALKAERTTFLSPFDSLFWPAHRDEAFWGFKKALEAYKPKEQRQFGYFVLPILHKDRLVGRFDPKMDRKTGMLLLKAIYLEPGVKPREELVSGMATALRSFLKFHKATDLVVERSSPVGLRRKLLAAI